MAQRLIVVDSGAVARTVTRFTVIDSGGTPRAIQRAFVIDSGSVARLFFSPATVTLNDLTVEGFSSVEAGAFISGYQLTNLGRIISRTDGIDIDIGSWVDPEAAAGSFEVRATIISGPSVSGLIGDFGSWLALSSSRFWGLQPVFAADQLVFTVEVRLVGSGSVSDTATITINLSTL